MNLPMQEMQVRFLGWEDPVEEETATHSSILAWEIPWTDLIPFQAHSSFYQVPESILLGMF